MPDYILTIVEQVGLMLAQLAQLKSGEKPARISAFCLRETGLPLDVVKHSSPETILQLLKAGGGTQYARAVLLAELLIQDADVNDDAGKNRGAIISRAQAAVLLEYSIDHLSPEEQAIYRPRLEALTSDLKRISR